MTVRDPAPSSLSRDAQSAERSADPEAKSQAIKSARVRLVVASVLLGIWLVYLGWLAWTNARPHIQLDPEFKIAKTRYEVLSRSQFLVADVDASVMVDKDGYVIDTPEVLWAREDMAAVKDQLEKYVQEHHLKINKELVNCQLEGKGPFLLPLVREGSTFHVASVPDMPAPRRDSEYIPPQELTRERIYNDTPKTRAQEREIRKSY